MKFALAQSSAEASAVGIIVPICIWLTMCWTSVKSTVCFFFFFNDPATTEIYTLSLHDALPIRTLSLTTSGADVPVAPLPGSPFFTVHRSEEHTSELQSLAYLVCRLLLEKK